MGGCQGEEIVPPDFSEHPALPVRANGVVRMCRMIAVVGDKDLQSRALRTFHRLGAEGVVRKGMQPGHLDGWGIAAYNEHGAAYVARSASSVADEKGKYFDAVEEVVEWRSPVVIAHFRKASLGDVQIENVHPFIDGPCIFCHNGTVKGMDVLGPKPPTAGSSDSEELFKRWRCEGPKVHFVEWLRSVEKNCRYTALVCLLTDGKELIATRRVGKDPLSVHDNPSTYANYYTLFQFRDGDQRIICSERLPEISSHWKLLADGEGMLVRL